jgi:hypothetical protein
MGAYYQPAVRIFRKALIVGTTNAFNRAVRNSLQELPSVVTAIGQSIERRAFPEAKFEKANLEIAANAQRAMVAQWRSRLPRNSAPYRPKDRLTGHLGSALANPAMLKGTSSHVISFINEDYLRKTAQHWYRINYGAAGPNLSGGREAQTFQVMLQDRPFLVLRDDLGPAPTSWLPRVFSWNDVGEMTRVRGPAGPTGKGVRAARFTDVGLGVVAEQFPKAYDRLFRAWLEDETAAARDRLAKKEIEVIADVRLERYGFTTVVH